MNRSEPVIDAGLDQELEDRLSGSFFSDPTEEEGGDADPDFEAWLIARELDMDEAADAILERAGGGW